MSVPATTLKDFNEIEKCNFPSTRDSAPSPRPLRIQLDHWPVLGLEVTEVYATLEFPSGSMLVNAASSSPPEAK